MARIFVFAVFLFGWQLSVAQDILIKNAQVLDGLGQSMDQGNVLISDGRISAVTAENITASDVLVIDGRGMTVMPGMINVHWHLFAGSVATTDEEVESYLNNAVTVTLDAILERGVTTIMSPGDHYPGILNVRQMLADGDIRGPRLLAVGPVFTAPADWPTQACMGEAGCNDRINVQLTTADGARESVREMAAAGVDAIKFVYDDIIAPDIRIADEVVAAIAEEAGEHGLTVYAHVSTTDVTATHLVDLGVRGFVHSSMPLGDGLAEMRDLGIPVATTSTVVMNVDFRHRLADADFVPAAAQYLELALGNIRTLWDAGVTVAFGTDAVAGPPGHHQAFFSTTASGEGLFLAEVWALSRVLSNEEIIISLTSNAATYLGMQDEIGTLETGKIADVILIAGNPLDDISDLEKVRVVIQGGKIVVDRR